MIKAGLARRLVALAAAMTVSALAVTGCAFRPLNRERAAGAEHFVDYRTTGPPLSREHVSTHVRYSQSPPVGGVHNPIWQECSGDVYDEQIANEHAVHSLEHGAVWITYRPDLPKGDVAKLASKVRGDDFLFMSPYPGQKTPISAQAWGYQLQVYTAANPLIDEFIGAYRQKASLEPGAPCIAGVAATGTNLKTAPG